MRHCEAESGERMDPTRALTATGRAQAATMGAWLANQVGRVDCVIASNFERAVQTWAQMSDVLPAGLFHTTPALDPDSTAVRAWAEIQRIAGDGNALVVTHHPVTDSLLEYLTGAKTDGDGFHHGFIVKIENGRVGWMVGPALVEDRAAPVIEAAIAVADAVLDAVDMEESAASRRNRALVKPRKRAEKAIRRMWNAQRDAFTNVALGFGYQEAVLKEAERDMIAAELRTALSGIPTNELLSDIFDDALSEALAAAAAHVAADFAYADEDYLATFEARYLANDGFAKITGGIDETTIDEVAQAVAKAYQNGASYQGIVDTIKATFKDFSEYRLGLIAQTELNNAYNAGIMEMGRAAGAKFKSSHTTTDNPCPACIENEAAGHIPIEQAFPAGGGQPTFHPMCGCSLELHAA